MTYNANTGSLEIPIEKLKHISGELKYTLRSIREIAGLPMGTYNRSGALTIADHSQRAIIDLARSLEINLGANWGHELDLRTDDEIKGGIL